MTQYVKHSAQSAVKSLTIWSGWAQKGFALHATIPVCHACQNLSLYRAGYVLFAGEGIALIVYLVLVVVIILM